jgi:hypothetical protein
MMDEMLELPEGQQELQSIKRGGDTGYEQNSYAGCHANLILIANDKIYVANAGRSRSVLC